MKRLLIMSAMFLTFQAHAEIFKCKDVNGNITYQGTPCLTGAGSKISKAPEVPIEEQIQAHTEANKTIEMDRQHEAARKLKQQEENAKKEAARGQENGQEEVVDQQTVTGSVSEAARRPAKVPAKRPGTLPATLPATPPTGRAAGRAGM
jgi:hypothetical protein